jgi:outer membrane lipoprotein carrier protein
MLRLIVCILSVFIITGNVLSEDLKCVGNPIENGKAELLFQELSQKLSGIKTLTANFRQTSYLSALELKEESSGKIWYQKPGQLIWHYFEPEEQTYLLSNQELQHFNKTDNIVTIKNVEQEVTSKIPLLILFGEQNITESFKLEKACQKDANNYFILIPVKVSGEDPISRIRAVTDENADILELAVLEKSGNSNIFLFSEKGYNAVLQQGTFEVKFPKNADVNDLRGINEQ